MFAGDSSHRALLDLLVIPVCSAGVVSIAEHGQHGAGGGRLSRQNVALAVVPARGKYMTGSSIIGSHACSCRDQLQAYDVLCMLCLQRGASKDNLFAYFRGQTKRNELTVWHLPSVCCSCQAAGPDCGLHQACCVVNIRNSQS